MDSEGPWCFGGDFGDNGAKHTAIGTWWAKGANNPSRWGRWRHWPTKFQWPNNWVAFATEYMGKYGEMRPAQSTPLEECLTTRLTFPAPFHAFRCAFRLHLPCFHGIYFLFNSRTTVRLLWLTGRGARGRGASSFA